MAESDGKTEKNARKVATRPHQDDFGVFRERCAELLAARGISAGAIGDLVQKNDGPNAKSVVNWLRGDYEPKGSNLAFGITHILAALHERNPGDPESLYHLVDHFWSRRELRAALALPLLTIPDAFTGWLVPNAEPLAPHVHAGLRDRLLAVAGRHGGGWLCVYAAPQTLGLATLAPLLEDDAVIGAYGGVAVQSAEVTEAVWRELPVRLAAAEMDDPAKPRLLVLSDVRDRTAARVRQYLTEHNTPDFVHLVLTDDAQVPTLLATSPAYLCELTPRPAARARVEATVDASPGKTQPVQPLSRAAQLLEAIPAEFRPTARMLLAAMMCCEPNVAWSRALVQAFNGAGDATNRPVIDVMLQQRLITGRPDKFVLTELGNIVATEHKKSLSQETLAELESLATTAWQHVPSQLRQIQQVTAAGQPTVQQALVWLIQYGLVQPGELRHRRGALTWEAVLRAYAARGVVAPLDLRSTVADWQTYSRRALRMAFGLSVGVLVLGQVLALVLLNNADVMMRLLSIVLRFGSPILALAVVLWTLGPWARQRAELWGWVEG